MLIRFAALWYTKARLWVEGRADMFERMRQQIAADDRVVWLHASSLGEFEQGRPIIERIRELNPEYKILLTFFSPSGYEVRKGYEGADYIFYIPADMPSNVRQFLDIAHPEIAIFVKREIWLNMLAELRRREVQSYLVSAVFRSSSIFFRTGGWLWREALCTFDTIFVQDSDSLNLLNSIGFHNVAISGDTRFDRVFKIASSVVDIPIVASFKGDKRLFVAGSTWGADEDILLPLINENPDIKFVIAPHEMNEERIARIIHSVQGGAVRYTQGESAALQEAQVLILDTIGILASVYAYADWAYIGGGFGAGIHSTLEAAIFGVPIAFGRKYSKFNEAVDMVELGVARSVCGASELREWFEPLRDDADYLAEIGRIAKEYTEKGVGATERIVAHIF